MGIPGLTLRLVNRGHWITMEQQLSKLVLGPETVRTDQLDKQQQESSEQSQQESQQQSQQQGQQQSQQQQQQQHPRNVVIIDGPSLAYHIGAEYRKDNIADRDAELKPSYKEIGARTVQFLEDMEVVGLQVHAIYFDGVLPVTKLEVRKQRLNQIMAQLEAKKKAMKAVKEASKKAPAPPFLVPAVLEALLDSRFGSLVTVVPAEADTYCAEEAAAYEAHTGKMATIITNDSDLLVQGSGTQTRVMFLTGLTRTGTQGSLRVEANVFFPAQLAASAGVDNLLLPAFLMNKDRHLSFDAAIAKSKKTSLDNDADFFAFQSELQKPKYDMSVFPAPVIETLQRMDPRIAELAHQTMPTFPHSRPEPANMFLVPLIEDMTRQSAWVSGRDIRNAAYRMVLSGSYNVYRVDEYTRRGKNCSSDPHAAGLGWKDDLVSCGEMISAAKGFEGLAEATIAQRFKYIAMYLTITALAARGRQLTRAQTTRVLAGERLQTREEMHALAMCQAAIYSLRLLKQLLALEKAMGRMDERLSPLAELLEEMPALAELFEKSAADTADFWDELAQGLRKTVAA